mgnify:CR=1 FL=1
MKEKKKQKILEYLKKISPLGATRDEISANTFISRTRTFELLRELCIEGKIIRVASNKGKPGRPKILYFYPLNETIIGEANE